MKTDMEKVKIAVFYGTTEGKELLNFLVDFDCELYGYVATEYGGDMSVPNSVKVNVGRLTKEEMADVFATRKFEYVVDATHPYAVEVSKNIKLACDNCGVQYVRVARNVESEVSGVKTFGSVADVCKYLNDKSGNVFLTTGSKNLGEFASGLDKERIFARVLPCSESFNLCESAGIKGKHIFACEGPFSIGMNVEMLKSVNASFMVTKQTGNAGGFAEKVESARLAGCELLVISSEEITDENDFGFDIAMVKKFFALSLDEVTPRTIDVVSMGVGGEDILTPQAKNAIANADVVFGAKRVAVGATGDVFTTYKLSEIGDILDENPQYRKIAVACTGDVGFHSVANGVRDYFGEMYDVNSFAGVGSISYFFAKINKNYQDCVFTSSHGENANIAVLVASHKKVFTLLGDAEKLVSTLCEYNLGEAVVYIGENLSYDSEKVTFGKASELLGHTFAPLSVAYIENENASGVTDLSDNDFVRGNIPMTKEEVRRICIAKLKLENHSVAYDIGGGTGSVSCGMAKICENGKVYSVECIEEGISLIKENARRLHLDNVVAVLGKAPEALLDLPTPTHVFIGGSRGNMREIMSCVIGKNPSVKIIATAVTIETVGEIMNVTREMGLACNVCEVNVSKSQKLGKYNMMKGENPIYIFDIN